MKNPNVSVIIPVYNSERYLRRCIDSVLAQTYKEWSLLLIDDGSKDGSGVICDEYSKKYSNITVYHNINSGPCEARNFGINHAEGEYIVFIDSDDWIGENHIKNMIEVLQKYSYNCFVMQGMTDVWGTIKNQNRLDSGIFDSSDSDDFFKHIQLYRHCGPCCKLFNSTILRQTLFNKNIIASEDFDVSLRYLDRFKGKIVVLNTCDYFYEHHSGSVSSRFYSYDIELSGLHVLDSTITNYLNTHSGCFMKQQFNEMLGNYTERVLFSIYSPFSSDFSTRYKQLKSVPIRYWYMYKKYAYSNTIFLRVVKLLLIAKLYFIVDFLMTIVFRKNRLLDYIKK